MEKDDPYFGTLSLQWLPQRWAETEDFALNAIQMQHRVVKPFEVFMREMAEQRNPFDPNGEILRWVRQL